MIFKGLKSSKAAAAAPPAAAGAGATTFGRSSQYSAQTESEINDHLQKSRSALL